MVMITDYLKTGTFTRFMETHYRIEPSDSSIDMLLQRGFRIFHDEQYQLRNLSRIAKSIRPRGLDATLVKVFTLAYAYEIASDSPNIELDSMWPGWLGSAEFKLAILIDDPLLTNFIFESALEHLLTSRRDGNFSNRNTALIGQCYYHIGDLYKALPFLEEAKQAGNCHPMLNNALHRCYDERNRIQGAVTDFMNGEYSIAPKEASIDILIEAGFRLWSTDKAQLRNLEPVQRLIGKKRHDQAVAKVFALAYPYHTAVASQETEFRKLWPGWLGSAEHALADFVPEDIKPILYEHALEHLLKSRDNGNTSVQNSSLIKVLRRYQQ